MQLLARLMDHVLAQRGQRATVVGATSGDTGGAAIAAFSGSDEAGYRYIIGSRHIDLRAKSRELNAAIQGRGGGSPEMIQGSRRAAQAEITEALMK